MPPLYQNLLLWCPFVGGGDTTSGAGGEGSDGVSTTLLKEPDEAEDYHFDYSKMNDHVPGAGEQGEEQR